MTRRLILEHTFGGRYWDKNYAIEVYRKHIQRVVGLVPKERLLQFDVKDELISIRSRCATTIYLLLTREGRNG